MSPYKSETKPKLSEDHYDEIETMLVDLMHMAIKSPDNMVDDIVETAMIAAKLLPVNRRERAIESAVFRAGIRMNNEQ